MSIVREVIVALLLGLSVALIAVSAVGLLAMRDPYQRLHFIAPPATSAFLFAAALAVDGAGAEACIKAIIVAILLALINGIITHATARAVFVHEHEKWPPEPGAAEPAGREDAF